MYFCLILLLIFLCNFFFFLFSASKNPSTLQCCSTDYKTALLALFWKAWQEVVVSWRGALQRWDPLSVQKRTSRKPSALLASYRAALWLWVCRVASSPPWPVEMWPTLEEKHRPSIYQRFLNHFSRTPGASSFKLSKWGSSCLYWKTATLKSSITPDFHRLRSPSSSFWISVSRWHL